MNIPKLAIALSLSTAVLLSANAEAENNLMDRVEVSGFGRLVAGYLDEDRVKYSGYQNSLDFDEQSLLGIQADATLTDSLSFTTQLLAHSGDGRDSGIEWLYLTYKPTFNTQIRVGKQRTPFYTYSDVLDVGYAYPWITPPRGVYNDYLFSTYEGINLQYTNTFNDVFFTLEGYWGSDNREIEIVGQVLRPNVNDLRGIIFKFQGEKFSGRLSAHTADTRILIPPLQSFIVTLREAGFNQSADTLSGQGAGDFYNASLKYEEINWFVEAEYNAARSEVLTFPSINGFAITGAYSWYPLTVFAVASAFDSDFAEPIDEIPVGVSPQLDLLAASYDDVFGSLFVDDSKIYTLGIRYDISDSVAIKASATFIDGKSGKRSFFERSPDDFNRRAMLYQTALEWVF